MVKYRLFTALLLLTMARMVSADWTPQWDVSINSGYCSLSRIYIDVTNFSQITFSNPNDSNGIGMLALAFSEVSADSDFLGIPVTAGEFALSVTTKIPNGYTGSTRSIIGIVVDGTSLSEIVIDDGMGQTVFFLRADRARSIFESFKKGRLVPIQIQFADGESGEFAFPESTDGEFVIWAAMLDACRMANAA